MKKTSSGVTLTNEQFQQLLAARTAPPVTEEWRKYVGGAAGKLVVTADVEHIDKVAVALSKDGQAKWHHLVPAGLKSGMDVAYVGNGHPEYGIALPIGDGWGFKPYNGPIQLAKEHEFFVQSSDPVVAGSEDAMRILASFVAQMVQKPTSPMTGLERKYQK